MEEVLGKVEFIKNEKEYIARIQTDIGGYREYRAKQIDEVLRQVTDDLQEEFESF